MRHDPQKYLDDVLNSAEFLIQFVENKRYDDFLNDRGFRSAIERELQIIGEAVIQLNKRHPHIAERISQRERIISFRHVIVHGYDQLDPEITWYVVQEKIPVLCKQVRDILQDLGSS